MILVHRHPFGVSQWHTERLEQAGRAARAHEKGLVVRVKVRFASWLGGEEVEADAFVDPGADSTTLSWRWLLSVRQQHQWRHDLDIQGGIIREAVFVTIGKCQLKLPAWSEGPCAGTQPSMGPPGEGDMPGFEDILLGRDFLTEHKLLVVIDGSEPSFSMLLPDSPTSQKARTTVQGALQTVADEP